MAGEVSSAHPEEEERRKEEDGDQPITAGQAAHLAKSTVHLGVNEHVNREVKGNPSADSSKDDEYTPDNFLHNGDRRKNNDDELVHYDYKTSSPLESLDKVPRDTLQPSPSSRRYNIEKHDSTEHMDAASWTGPLASSRSFNSCQSRNLYSSATSEEGRELLNAKLLRKKADEELMARKNRVNRLRFEEERTYKTIFVAKAKVQDVVRLKAHNQLRNQEKEHARKSKAERLREETQQNSLERARRIANIRAKQMELVRTKQDIVKNSHKEREIYAQACLSLSSMWI
ncbi:hypothetical protein GUITHDRAFT_102754 [Guillardia theta CCMP2712]|uniref:Uncharacterized protein n=1 Tax=Guillardia theta (strain CCMP2712) TaxID=905079 RepID=L1JSF0_GUITC|nr:hypothetical protein GUITHDRAFT_102754 [Guillardia theta CCMP2712]EKX51486.1 hypothetical protein GUITHDRAFT_102754 [Guillardia theta CCMP2712]|eukprot:XP_005838466.1 hypothetical protein GUITHDRAFT_102754 [Guillardia theta CCMP2712]